MFNCLGLSTRLPRPLSPLSSSPTWPRPSGTLATWLSKIHSGLEPWRAARGSKIARLSKRKKAESTLTYLIDLLSLVGL